MPSIVKNDPWWFADPHRKAYTEQAVLGETIPAYWAFNPAYAEVQSTHVWPIAWADIIQNGLTPEAAAEKAFRASGSDLREISDRHDLRKDGGAVAPVAAAIIAIS